MFFAMLYNIIIMPIIMLVEYVLALGFTLIFSAWTIYLRDLKHVLGIITMAWQFATPVMYSMDMVPEKMRWVFRLNPMSSVIEAYRSILYYKQAPDLRTLLEAVVIGVVFLVFGAFLFRRLQRGFAENL